MTDSYLGCHSNGDEYTLAKQLVLWGKSIDVANDRFWYVLIPRYHFEVEHQKYPYKAGLKMRWSEKLDNPNENVSG